MKSKSVYKAVTALLCIALASMTFVNEAKADGTEQLGPPVGITIADGSAIVVAGVGLNDPGAQPGDITIEIPSGVTVAQVLLYWTGRSVEGTDPGNSDTIQVNGMDVTGPRIGGPTTPSIPNPCHTYRADITEMSDTNGWIIAGQPNVVSVGGLDFAYHNGGAALAVILDDGSMADIQIMDGSDYAFLNRGYQTEPVEFPVVPSSDPQMGYMWMIVSDISIPRPAAVDVIVDGITNRLENLFLVNEGNFLSIVELEIDVPAGASNVIVQVLSIDDASELEPASLAWTFVSWELPEPEEDEGCTYTVGYWKNHPEDWPTDTLSIFTGAKAMDLLWTKPKGGNAYIILAHQYIAAELNVVNGASIPQEVEQAWLDAQALLVQYESAGDIDKKTEAEDRAEAIYLAGMLDDYNNGLVGPGHCDDNCQWD